MWRDSDLEGLTLSDIFDLAFAYRILRSFEWSGDGLILRVFTTHAMPLLSPSEARIYLINCLTAIPVSERTVWLEERAPGAPPEDEAGEPEG